MAVKVGIPRALLYYEFFHMWRIFFEELGVEVVVSDNTNKKILNDGVRVSVDEACLPVKLFQGHVMNLKDRVDYIFIPRLKSVARNEYICPKFCGLPEMITHTMKGLDNIIDTEINMRNSESQLYKAFLTIGRYFTNNTGQISWAYEKAMAEHKKYLLELQKGSNGAKVSEGAVEPMVRKADSKIAVIGHVYNLYDAYVNMGLIDKVRQNGIQVITPEELDADTINHKADLLPKKMFWTFGKRLIGSVIHLVDQKDIDGIIYVMSFGCGIDAFVSDLCERYVRRNSDIPFFLLTLDEHSGEAGINTRLEAFIDMIGWRKRNGSNVSAYG